MFSYLVLLALLSSVVAQLPNGWKACSKSAPDYEQCLIREVTNACNSLMNGDKKLGSPPIDPLRLEKVHIPKHNSPVSIDLTFTGVEFTGLKNIKILKAKNDWKTGKAVMSIPDINGQGNYKIDGKVLVLPVVGEGRFNLTLHDVELNPDIIWKQIEKGGKKYFQMESVDVDVRPKKLYVHFNNLFNGDKALGDNMNLFLNENWDKILDEIRPAISQGLSQAVTQISNVVLSKIPADQIDIP